MPNENRRAHKKSRAGCLVCKQRRVKCDEGRPRCGRCAIGDRACRYAGDKPGASASSAHHHYKTFGGATTPLGLLSLDGGTDSVTPGETFSAIHMTLLYHLTTNMAEIMDLDDNVQIIVRIALESSHKCPYLLDEMLAVSALHLSVKRPERADVFRRVATELQTRAVSSFNDTRDRPEEEKNVMSDFLFATHLGMHVLQSTLLDSTQSLGVFISAFVKYVGIHRGVRAVMSESWPAMLESELKPLLTIANCARSIEAPVGSDTAEAKTFLEAQPDPSRPSLEALRTIQWILDITKHDSPDVANRIGVQAVFAWPIIISDAYIDQLYQHRPEALVALAFFAALLHRHRDFWVFGDFGHILVQMISNHVGPFWEEALAWPRQMILSAGPAAAAAPAPAEGPDVLSAGSAGVTPASDMFYGTPLS